MNYYMYKIKSYLMIASIAHTIDIHCYFFVV